MTENKRFTFADGFKIVAIRDNGEIMNSKEVCEKLNELYDENKRLQKENKILYDENIQLRNKLLHFIQLRDDVKYLEEKGVF